MRRACELAIRYSAEREGMCEERLFGEFIAPVAHPGLGIGTLDAAMVSEHVLLEFEDARLPWLQWRNQLATMGLGNVAPKGIVCFNRYDQVILAALAGQGIALGRLALIMPLLSDRRLQALGMGQRGFANSHAYWLMKGSAAPRKDVIDVIDWVRSEAGGIDEDCRALAHRASSAADASPICRSRGT